jgi:cell division septation protein DedD
MAESYEISKQQLYLLIAISVFLAALFLILGMTLGANYVGSSSQIPVPPNPDLHSDASPDKITATPCVVIENEQIDQASPIPGSKPDKTPDDKQNKSDPVPRTGIGYAIQVTSVSSKQNALTELKRLQSQNYPVYLSEVRYSNNRVNYRVRVGPFTHRSEAEDVGKDLERKMKYKSWILQVDMSRENR